MARYKKNILLSGSCGRIGEFIIKQTARGQVLSKYPDMSGIVPSTDQKAQRTRFRRAIDYAKEILADPARKALYEQKLKRGRTVYHTAIAEYLAKNPA